MTSYDDGLVALDRRAITLRRYHFPSGTAKVIPLSAVAGYRAEPLGMVHRFRIWGSSDLRRWLPLDIKRPMRTTLITLDLAGSPWPQPAFTPAEPAKLQKLLDELLAGDQPTGQPSAST